MSYAAVAGQGHIGLLQIWAKAWSANHGADPDFNSTDGFTQILEIDPESPANLNFTEEFVAQRSANQVGAHREDLVDQMMSLDGVANIVNEYSLAYIAGMINASISDKTADDPTRLQLPIGGYRTTNYYSFIIRQRHPDITDKWVGFYLLKGHIKTNGALNLQVKDHQKLGFEIKCVIEVGGSHDGVFGYHYEEYDAASPVISTILPASQSVGNAVEIEGTGFGSTQGDSVVTFYNDKEVATVLNWSSNSLTVVIPADATTGNVTVTVGGVESAAKSYTIV